MTGNSLDLSGKIDQSSLDLLQVICQVTKQLGISYIVVGATARDLALHYGYGAAIKRATTDVDFGLQMNNWEEFDQLKSELLKQGFKATESAHKMFSPAGKQIDMVPFGGLENHSASILWPPDDEMEMCMLGFQEAHDHAIEVILQQEPKFKIPVVTPPGLVLLKLISWADRGRHKRQRDAEDLTYSLENYEKIGEVLARVYEENIAEKYEYDISLASAHILGMDTAGIARKKTSRKVNEILKQNLTASGPNLLVEEMCGNIENEYKNKLKLLQAFADGFGAKE